MDCPTFTRHTNARSDAGMDCYKEVDPMTFNRIAPFVALFVIFAVLQLALIAADCLQNPASVARAFAEDYFYLDTDMQKWISHKNGDPKAMVDDLLYKKGQEASQRGFSTNYLRRLFTHIHVTTEHVEDGRAAVHVKGNTRIAINRIFMIVGKLFGMSRDYPVDATIYLTREDGKWRVLPDSFAMMPQ